MKYLMWLLKAAIFFTLFAFALNNQQTVAVHFFFGTLWQAPLVLVVLTVFAAGLAFGIFVMMPRWRKKPPSSPRTGFATSMGPLEERPARPRHGL